MTNQNRQETGQWAEQQKKGMKDQNQNATESEARRVVEGSEADQQSQRPGDNRTPDKTIGQVNYADNEGGGEQKKQGGSTRTTTPEKQGGIGGL